MTALALTLAFVAIAFFMVRGRVKKIRQTADDIRQLRAEVKAKSQAIKDLQTEVNHLKEENEFLRGNIRAFWRKN